MAKNKPADCAYCSMPSECACEQSIELQAMGRRIPCNTPMCRKCRNNRLADGRDLCKNHRAIDFAVRVA